MIGNPHQHTRDWWLARRGKLTSSRMKTVVHGLGRGWLTLMNHMRDELASEDPIEKDLSFVEAIAHGYHYEPRARAAAELLLDEEFELVGFELHSRYQYIGCSSDALREKRRRNVEIKCPLSKARHMQVYQTQTMPDEHMAQVQAQMFVWDVEFTDFISYHPDMPHWKMQTVILEVPRNEFYIQTMLERSAQFMDQFSGTRPPAVRGRSIPKLF
jgi:putative phage-type endonuclease